MSQLTHLDQLEAEDLDTTRKLHKITEFRGRSCKAFDISGKPGYNDPIAHEARPEAGKEAAANMPFPDKQELYTFADYLTWDETERLEIIDGAPVMQAAPTPTHQRMLSELNRQFANFLEGKPCMVFPAPFAVRLNAKEDGSDTTVVEPDLTVVCDRSRLDGKGYKGAPDLVVEILSPGTARMDRLVKYNLYQQAGVREYWIADPETKTLDVAVLINGTFTRTAVYSETSTVSVNILNGCTIDLSKVFIDL